MKIMEFIGMFCMLSVIIWLTAISIATVLAILWFIHPSISIGAVLLVTYMWFDKKNSIRF